MRLGHGACYRLWHGKYKLTDQDAPPPPRGHRGRGRDAWIDSERGVAHLLRGSLKTPHSGVWREAKERFRSALADIERLRNEREAAAVALRDLPAAQASLLAAEQAADRAVARLRECRAVVPGAEQALNRAETLRAEAEARRAAHFSRRPGLMVSLFTLGRAAGDWHRADQELAGEEAEQRAVRAGARGRLEAAPAGDGRRPAAPRCSSRYLQQ
ncbi:hypothetical protein [Streptomyces capitiformicae]|uniref:Uncharacterized protein n=1 Tax=Streptomyces capitiformicae TaxID=2014920 RepID=A0A918ZPA6_9ACTN|nr:hypothetical protein [Streptomyces capitiformicae]GHE63131.1 hypothetical protein GCM10017771_86480 [Streptomyces capitiformicae]